MKNDNDNDKMNDVIDVVLRDVGGIEGFNASDDETKYKLIREMMGRWEEYKSLKKSHNSN
jgi:hypothetical protein